LHVALNDIRVQAPQLIWQFETPLEVPRVLADPIRAAQVVRNLLSNAMKFTPATGRVSVAIRPLQSGDRFLSVSVEDTGCGIPAVDRDRIFERLFQREQNDSQLHRGLGLGLFICRAIVEAHGGRIWIEEVAGPGTRFVFTLPIAPAAEDVCERTES
jgi:signal transduction histidine kinase